MSTDDTYLRVERGGSGRVRAVTRNGALTPRLVDLGADTARVVLVATRALLLAGDDVRLRIEVGAGTHLDLADVAATVAYDGRGRRSSWAAQVTVDEGASLTWRAEPFVVSDGADTTRRLDVAVADGGRLHLRDTLVLGRAGEDGGTVRSRTRVAVGGRPALAEDLDVCGAAPEPTVLGGARVVDQVLALGAPVDHLPGCVVLDLPQGGTCVRWLGTAAHASPLHGLPARFERSDARP